MIRKKDYGLIIFVIVAMTAISGCAQLKEKFIPKKKEAPTTRRYKTVREYDVRPSVELYTKRYVFWKTWQSELIDVIDDSNKKKKTVAVEQAILNLESMRSMLVQSKAEKLGVLIDEMKVLESTIKNERISGANKVRVKRRLETIERAVRRDFSYNDIEGYIGEDFEK